MLLVESILGAQQGGQPPLDRAAAAYRAGKSAEAEQILKTILAKQPGDLGALELMGIVLDAESQYQNAELYYRQALEIAPASAQLLNNFANHYISSGDRRHARDLYLKTVAVDIHHTNANLQLAQLSVEDKQGQLALKYLNNLNSRVASEPGNLLLRARALGLCSRCAEANEILRNLAKRDGAPPLRFSIGMALAECKFYSEAEEAFSRALETDPQNFEIMYNVGLAALRAGDVERAESVLENALKVRPRDADSLHALAEARIGVALLLFHRQGAEAALRELDKTAEAERTSDDYLLRAQLLDSQGKLPEAAAALNQSLRAAPARASLYYEAVDFLLKHKLYHEAQTFLEAASRVRPDDRDLLLAQAITLNLLRRNSDSEKMLVQIQTKWPQWGGVYLVKGMLLEIALKSADARQTLEKAIALGANTPEAYYYEALAITHAAPEDLDAAQAAISHALALTSEDPYVYLLAGKIALARKDYSAAIKYLLDATRLYPSLVPAHYALRHAYSALGEDQKSQAEMETIKHIANKTGGTDESRFAVENFLFAVRPPP
jgi:tetratricopeptide (TPR) repeat protein